MYAIIKVVKPARGEWRIVYEGDGSANGVTAQYMLAYDLELKASVPETQVNKSKPLTVSAVFRHNGTPVTDEALYQIPATLSILRNGEVIATRRMNANANGYSYTFDSMKEFGAGRYTFAITCAGSGLSCKAEDLTLLVENKAPALVSGSSATINHRFVINTPGDEDSYTRTREATWDLSAMVADPDGDDVSYEVQCPGEIRAEVRGGILTVSTRKDQPAENAVVKVTPKDVEGAAGPVLEFHIDVVSTEAAIGVRAEATPASVLKTDDTTRVRAQYTLDGTALSQSDYYAFEATLTLKKNGSEIGAFTMMRDQDAYTVTIPGLKQYGTGIFEAFVTVRNGSFVRESAPVRIELMNRAPVQTGSLELDCSFIINDPERPESYQPDSRTFALTELVSDPDGDVLTWTVQGYAAEVDTTLAGGVLTITSRPDRPTEGDVVVTVKDSDGTEGPVVTIHVKVVSVEDSTELAVAVPEQPVAKEQPVTIRAQYRQGGRNVAAEAGLNQIPLTLTVRKGTMVVAEDLPMTGDRGMFTCELKDLAKYGAGEYTVTVHAEKEAFVMDSKPLTFRLTNAAPALAAGVKTTLDQRFDINIPGDAGSYREQEATIDLSGMALDPNGDALTWFVKTNQTNTSAFISGAGLTIVTFEGAATDGDIVVCAKDTEGVEGPDVTVHVQVVSVEAAYEKYSVDILPISGEKNSDVPVRVVVRNEAGETIVGDQYLPAAIPALVSANGTETRIVLDRGEDGIYAGTFRTGGSEAEYTVTATVSVGGKTLVADPATFSTTNRGPEMKADLTGKIGGLAFIGITRIGPVDLNEIFADPDGDALTFTIVDGDALQACAEVELTDGRLTIVPKRANGLMPVQVSFCIAAADHEGGRVESMPVTLNVWPVLLHTTIIAALVLVLTVTILAIRWKGSRFGRAAFDVSYGVKGLELPEGLSDALPEGKHAAVKLAGYVTMYAGKGCAPAITDGMLGLIRVCPLTGGRVKIVCPGSAGVTLAAGLVTDYDTDAGRYRVPKKGTGALILRSGKEFTVLKDDRRMSFRLVEIRTVEASPEKKA